MSAESNATMSDGSSFDGSRRGRVERPLADPRPIGRPEVDGSVAAAFARPDGVAGGSDPRRETPALSTPPRPAADPVLREAFAPGDEGTDPLGRPPVPPSVPVPTVDAFDPWRDPAAPVGMGLPAHRPDEDEPVVDLVGPPPTRLGVRDVLFGGHVSARALAALATVAALVGLAGGAVGSLVAGSARVLTSDTVRLSDAPDGAARPDNPIGAVVERVMPSVVNIQISSPQAEGEGSGVVIDPTGYIVTNNHVVTMEGRAGPDAVREVVFSDGKRVPGKVVGTDPLTDLAVLKVDDVAGLTVATLGHSGNVQVGERVIAIGSPLGLSKTVTEGIVSALNRPIALGEGGRGGDVVIDAVQTDASINPGNSGGPLIDSTGAVVGINTSIFTQSGGSIGLGFSIPVDDVRTIATTLIREGAIRHATIGVSARTAANGATDGAAIANVKADGAGARAGLREGDVITRVGDRSIHSSDELIVAVRKAGADRDVRMEIIREGKKVDLTARPTLG